MRIRKLAWLLLPGLALGLVACEVEQTEEGEVPDVSVEGGKLPKFDVSTPDVDVRMEERTVRVPTVDVQPSEEDEEASAGEATRSEAGG